MKKILVILSLCFLIAVIIRFWWFPNNIYFGFDQARDAFISQSIYLEKHIKVIGPSAGKEGLYHGPLWWYLIGPLYLLGGGDPAYPLGFISFLNALGVFLVFFAGKRLFNPTAGLIAAFLYAISFSESQYALYFGNPAPAVLSILIFYLGFVLLIFSKNKWGWPLIGFGLGISIQSEFFLIYLFLPVLVYLALFRREIWKNFNARFFTLGLLILLLTVSTFLLAELKFGFRTLKTLFSMGSVLGGESGVVAKLDHFLSRLGTEINDNLFSFFPGGMKYIIFFLAIALLFFLLAQRKNESKKIVFLLVWILSNIILDFLGAPYLYYVNIGVSAGLIILAAYFLAWSWQRNRLFFLFLISVVIASNLQLIISQNPKGPVNTLYVQDGMLLKDQKKVLDRIYQDANGKPFIFNALTMPYKIKTTWAYLFHWYGQEKYGYLPFWGGDDVPGYPGDLPKPDSRDYPRYAVIEPTRGIPEKLRQEFQASENGYSLPVWEEKIGQFVIQKRL